MLFAHALWKNLEIDMRKIIWTSDVVPRARDHTESIHKRVPTYMETRCIALGRGGDWGVLDVGHRKRAVRSVSETRGRAECRGETSGDLSDRRNGVHFMVSKAVREGRVQYVEEKNDGKTGTAYDLEIPTAVWDRAKRWKMSFVVPRLGLHHV